MSRISRNLSIALRTERLIARRQLAVMRSQTGLFLFAGLVAGIGVIMANIALFIVLSNTLSEELAAMVVAVGNIGLAAVLVSIASRLNAEDDLKPVVELRDAAIAELETDLAAAAADAKDLTDNVRRIARDPLGNLLPALIGPLLSILTSSKKD